MLVAVEGDTPALLDDAKQIVHLLHSCYPGHTWAVRCSPGLIYIRDLDFSKNWGMKCDLKESFSASALKKEIVMKAGEWLERANKKRGAGDPENVTFRVEGVPEKDQPAVIETTNSLVVDGIDGLRTVARPQAKNA